MSYVKVDIPDLDTRGIYLWLEDYVGDTVTTFKPIGEYKLQIRIKTNGKLTKKTFKFPKSKTFRKAIEQVSDKRLDLKSEYDERGTLRPEKIEIKQKDKTFKNNWDKYIKDISITAKIGSIKNFDRSAKVERIYLNEYSSIAELKADIKDYIYFYNHKRFHQTLEYKKPMNVYYESLKINNKDYIKLSEDVA